MKKGLFSIVLFISASLLVSLYAQEYDTITVVDNAQLEMKATKLSGDTVVPPKESVVVMDLDVDNSLPVLNLEPVPFKPNPTKAVLYSAACPGLGQIYNRKYWKLPIVYGGFLGVVYAVSWNGGYYDDYKQAYRDLALGTGNSWENFYPDVGDIESDPNRKQQLLDRLRRNKDYFRRNRDLAILVGVGLYALCMIDAYVDAQLYDFNMSQDLSMTVSPMLMPPTATTRASVGLQCTIRF